MPSTGSMLLTEKVTPQQTVFFVVCHSKEPHDTKTMLNYGFRRQEVEEPIDVECKGEEMQEANDAEGICDMSFLGHFCFHVLKSTELIRRISMIFQMEKPRHFHKIKTWFFHFITFS